MAAAAEEELSFPFMSEARLRQWVEANPGRVNDRDENGLTPLYVAVWRLKSLPLTVWLLDEKGADVNGTVAHGYTPLYYAPSLDILTALMDRGADPTLPNDYCQSPVVLQARFGTVDNVARLLQDSRVRAILNVQNSSGYTALHWACNNDETSATAIIHLLLQARGDPTLTTNNGHTPLAFLRQRLPSYLAAIALLEQHPAAQKDAEKASLLVKVRRLVVAAKGKTVAPSCLQGREARDQPLPQLALMPVTAGQNENEDEDEQETRKLRTLMAFLLGMEGGWENAGMPRDVFRVVLDLLMPTWDPLRPKNAGAAPPLHQN